MLERLHSFWMMVFHHGDAERTERKRAQIERSSKRALSIVRLDIPSENPVRANAVQPERSCIKSSVLRDWDQGIPRDLNFMPKFNTALIQSIAHVHTLVVIYRIQYYPRHLSFPGPLSPNYFVRQSDFPPSATHVKNLYILPAPPKKTSLISVADPCMVLSTAATLCSCKL